MTELKGGNVIGIRLASGDTISNEDGSPLVFIVEDVKGELHELLLSVGRMGSYTMLTLPPFRVAKGGDYGDGPKDRRREQEEEKGGVEYSLSLNEPKERLVGGVPVAVQPPRRRTTASRRKK